MNRSLSSAVLGPKGFLAGTINRFRYYRFMHTTLDDLVRFNCTALAVPRPEQIDLVSLSFNNVYVVAHQIRLIQKYLLDPYVYTVADNSSDPHKRRAILELCQQHGVSYVGLPSNPYTGVSGSMSQGAALNWLYYQYIRKRSARYFGFIDHDIFPIRPTSLIQRVSGKRVYGHIQERGSRYYLWAGFCLFERDAVRELDLSFLPWEGLDAGGGNWRALYAHMDAATLHRPKHAYGRLRDGDCAQADWYEMIGDWIHTFNASYWMAVPDKDDLVGALLSRF